MVGSAPRATLRASVGTQGVCGACMPTLRPACMQRSAALCPPAATWDRLRAARRRCRRGAGRACSGRSHGWGQQGWLGMVPHHAVLRRQSARLCLDLRPAGLAWVDAKAAASAGRWRAAVHAQGCRAPAENVRQAGSVGAACEPSGACLGAGRRCGKRESLHAPCRGAAWLSRACPLPCALVGSTCGSAAGRHGASGLRRQGLACCRLQPVPACSVGAQRAPQVADAVRRAPRHLCKSSSLAGSEYQSMP